MEFSLSEKKTDLGRIPDPKIPVFVKTVRGFEPYFFLLDTGADFTVLPRVFAALIGLKLPSLPRIRLSGVEGHGMTAFVAKIELRLGKFPFEATALISADDTTPLILGRQGLFDKFNIFFDNRKKVIKISPL